MADTRLPVVAVQPLLRTTTLRSVGQAVVHLVQSVLLLLERRGKATQGELEQAHTLVQQAAVAVVPVQQVETLQRQLAALEE